MDAVGGRSEVSVEMRLGEVSRRVVNRTTILKNVGGWFPLGVVWRDEAGVFWCDYFLSRTTASHIAYTLMAGFFLDHLFPDLVES